MDEIRFVPPNGPEYNNPSFPMIATAVLEHGDDYWQTGTSDAGIFYHTDDNVFQLILMKYSRFGVFVLHGSNNNSEERALSESAEMMESTVCVEQGGEPWELPINVFVSPDYAVSAIKFFMDNQGRRSNQNWIPF